MSRRAIRAALVALAMTAAAGCQQAPVHAVLYYNFALVGLSPTGQHYQQFAQENGAVIDVGCLVVERRQTNCYDTGGNGEPNLHNAVVECPAPCTALVPDPCDPTRPKVHDGIVRGLVDEPSGPIVLGGVEIPTNIELGDADQLFITREKDDDPSPQPSTDILLTGDLRRDGAVLRANLTSPSLDPAQGAVTIVPVRDEVSI